MIRVLLVDDHQVLIDGIKALIEPEEDISVDAMAFNGAEALEILRCTDIDLVLLDINMPVMDGLGTCEKVHLDHPDVKVIAMSMFGEGELVRSMLDKGARGYLLKSCGKDELLEAIRTVHAGGSWLSRKAMDGLVETMHQPSITIKAPIEELTPRELEVLRLIATEYTTADISSKLQITVNTVESHRRNILSKLNARNMAGLIRRALKMGLIE